MFQSVYLLEVKQSRVFKRGEAPLPTSPSPLKERGITGGEVDNEYQSHGL